MATKKKTNLKKSAKKVKKSLKKPNIQETPKTTTVEPQLISRLQFAKKLNIGYNTVAHAIKTGKIHVTNSGGKVLINYETEKIAYLNSRKGKYKTGLKIGKEDEHGILLEIGDANLRTSVYKSKSAEMEYWSRMGHLIPVVRVNSLWGNIARDLQKAILAIAPRVGPLMAGITDPHEATQTLKHELNLALTNISTKGLKQDVEDEASGVA